MIKLKYTLVLASILLFASCNEQNKQIADTSVETNDIISIQKQGTFAVGGSVKKSPGTFDPITHGAYNPLNQSTQ
ncbi:MAG: alpha/beta hydrolase, partial [Maribacter dokdonensis]